MSWKNIQVYIALTSVSLLYGINYSILKIVIPEYVGAFGLIVYRIVISASIFWLIFLFSFERVDWKADGIRLLLSSLAGAAINMLLFYKGMSLTSAVNGSIIMTLTPVLVLVWASVLIKERITKFKVIGIVIAMIGAVIIFYSPGMELPGDWRGDMLILFNGTSYACYLVIVKPLMKKYKPITVVTWVFTLAIPFVLPFGYSEAMEVNILNLPNNVLLSISYTILLVTVLVYFLNIWTLIQVDSSVVGAFIYLQPVFAILTAILFFGEVFLVKHLVAALFVFTGVWLVTKKAA